VCGSSASLYRVRSMRRECSVSLIRRVALSRGHRKQTCQITPDPQYTAFCKVWTFTKSQIINHVTATEKSQLQLQSVSTCLNNQPDEIEIALGSKSLLKMQNMSQSQHVHVLGLQRPKQPRLVNSLSPIDGEALGAYLAKVQLCSAYGGSQSSKSHLTSNLLRPQSTHILINDTTVPRTCGMHSSANVIIDANVPASRHRGQSLQNLGLSEVKTM
jgi:hypothetical protein